MTRRSKLIGIIQDLSADEGARQPSAADWLLSQDDKAQDRLDQGCAEGDQFKAGDDDEPPR